MDSERQPMVDQWLEAQSDGLWYVAWSKCLDGLTAQQAAWKPGPGRNSIWQIANHMAFWREVVLEYPTEGRPADDVVNRSNFETPAEVSEAAWKRTRDRFTETHSRIATMMKDPNKPVKRLRYLVPHDSYHVGQIMLLRAMQGLPSIE